MDKTSLRRVREVRSFSYRTNPDQNLLWNTGDTTRSVTVTPAQTTTYSVTVSSPTGCDGVEQHTIVVNMPDTVEMEHTVCEHYDWNGTTYTESGDYTQTFTNQFGCDSIVTLHLTVNYGTHNVTDTTVCESFTWTDGTGETYTVSGTYIYDYTNSDGCPSADTLHLTVNYGTHNVTDTTVCESYTWAGGSGETYTVSGTYIYDYTNRDGCPSADTLHLTVNYGTHNVTDTAVCESYTWTGGTGDTYTESGTYTFSYTNAAGCASTDTLHLAVHHAVYELVETTACESYEWNGQFYTESGDYTQTFVNQYGCDSVVTLHLMVNRGTHHVTDTAVCGSYTWTAGTGDTYTESGTYTFRYTNADGCPSADTLHLSMMDLIAVTVAATTDTVCPGDSVTLYADAIAPSMVDSHVPPVAVGDILCTDNSIVKPSEWPVPGKTAMGIVCYVDNSDEHGWAIHLHDYGTRVAWSTTSTDISGLANFATGVTAITDLDGYTNTQRIRSAGNASTYPAAYAVDFAQGWYLPASAQMRCVYSKIPILNASLQMVGGTPFSMTAIWGYWSSTEADSSRAWHLDENGQITSYYKTTNYLVRSARNF